MPASTEFMIAAVQSDFDVHLVKQVKDTALFAAKRQDTWHFVHWDAGNGQNFINQVHVPRYRAAFAMDSRLRGGPVEQSDTVRLHHGWHDLNFGQNSDGRFGPIYAESWFPCSDEWRQRFEEDVKVLERGRQAVVNEGGTYTLRDAKTFNGHSVSSRSWKLIEAIAFERESRGVLDARDFALYSAFCTLRDFSTAMAIPVETVRGFIEEQSQYIDIDRVPDDILDATMRMQVEHFAAPIWGSGSEVAMDQAVEILGGALRQLGDAQRAQVNLLSGMHNTWIMAVMATLLGYMSFERYAQIKTQGLAPDSMEEQEIRTHLSFIELLGALAED